METPKINQIIRLLVTDSHDKVIEAQSYSEQNRVDVQKELQLFVDNPQEIHRLTDSMFQGKIPVDRQLYTRISNAQFCMGWEEMSCRVLGKVFAEAYDTLTSEVGEKLLELLPGIGHEIFSVLPSLPEFLSRTVLREEFIASWFVSLASKIETDSASGPFFDGVYAFATHFPAKGLKVLELYECDRFDGVRLDIATVILGAIRTCVDNGEMTRQSIKDIEDSLSCHPNIYHRHIYSRSWVRYFAGGTVSADVLFTALEEMTEWTNDDIDDAFWVLSRCILSRSKDEQFLVKASEWLKRKTNSDLPKVAKYAVVELAYRLLQKIKINLAPPIIETDELILAVQPLTADQKGALSLIQLYLVVRLTQDKKDFGNILKKLATRSPKLIPEAIREHELTHLVNKLAGDYGSSLITELLLSAKVSERRLGRALLEEVEIDKLDSDALASRGSTEALHVLHLEIARRPFLSKLASRIYLLLLPFYEDADASLRQEFVEDMVYQAINFPGSCYQVWKDVSNPTPTLVEVLARAKTYFDRFDSLKACSGGHATFPEWSAALKKWERRFSAEINEGARKASVLASLVRHIDIIYGSEWSIAETSQLSDPQPMSTFSHGTEFPRLEILDPEGCVLRR